MIKFLLEFSGLEGAHIWSCYGVPPPREVCGGDCRELMFISIYSEYVYGRIRDRFGTHPGIQGFNRQGIINSMDSRDQS